MLFLRPITIHMNRLIAISFFIILSSSALAQNTLQQAAETLVSDSVFSHAAVGIQAVRGNGETLISAGKDKMLVPASNMKLISTGAALFSLGPDYRFSTTLAHDGHISDGVLHGNLYIVGGGDPLLGSKDSSAVALSSVFEGWVRSLKRAEIRKIEGRVIGDGRWLDGPAEEPTWLWNDLGTYYGTGVTGLMFYENMMSFSVSPGREVGAPVNIEPYYPDCPWMTFMYEGTTGAKGTGDRLYMYTSEFAPVAAIRGTFGIDRGKKRVDCSNKFPEYTCAVYFRDHLDRNGISCSGEAADFRLRRDWMAGTVPASGIGADGDSLKILDTFDSPSLARIAFKTNHESNNLCAETLLRTLGKENRGSSCYDSSYIALRDILKKMHVGTSGLSVQDGSGLSRQNLVSADFFCRFLRAMMDSPCFEEFLWSLPIPGGNGSLSYNMKGYPLELRSRIRVKSGSMNGVRCYSGYILPSGFVFEPGSEIPQDVKDKIVIFSILTGNCVSPSWKVRPMLDRMMAEMAR